MVKPFFCFFGGILGAFSSYAAEAILIGGIAPMTGTESAVGQSTNNGIEMAKDETNENEPTGVLGRNVQFDMQNSRGIPEVAISAFNLLRDKKAVAVIGEQTSGRTMAIAPLALKAHLPLLSPPATNTQVTAMNDYVFRACFIDPFQGGAMAQFAYEKLGGRKAAIIVDYGNDYALGLANYFQRRFEKLGGKFVRFGFFQFKRMAYFARDTDFEALVTAVKYRKPDLVFLAGQFGEVALILRAAERQGVDVPFLGGDVWDSAALIDIAGEGANGNYFSTHYSPEDKSPLVRNFVERYRQRFGTRPDAFAALGYDSFKMVVDAIRRANSTDGPKIRDALAATKNFQGVTGIITMDVNRNAIKPLVIMKIVDGTPHSVNRVEQTQDSFRFE